MRKQILHYSTDFPGNQEQTTFFRWFQATNDFQSCYYQLTERQKVATDCQEDELTNLRQLMQQELVRMNADVKHCCSTACLARHTRKLRSLVRLVQTKLWSYSEVNA